MPLCDLAAQSSATRFCLVEPQLIFIPGRYVKDEVVRGIPCETFAYTEKNTEFGGPGLMGRKVDITMTVS